MTETKVKNEKGLCRVGLNEEVCCGNKTILNEEFHDSSSQWLKHLKIDPNMTEAEDATNCHMTENNINPVSSTIDV